MVRKLLLPFPLLSDPEGAVIQRYGVWNEKERIAIPAIVVIDQADVIRYVYAGRDFADRPGDEAVFEALDKAGSEPVTPLGKPGIQVTAEEAETTPDRGRNAYTLENLVPYYRGVYFATVALKERLAARPRENRDAIREIGQYQQMVQRYSEALRETITMTRESEERTP